MPGCPSVERSSTPGWFCRALIRSSRMARPTVALGRRSGPGPNRLCPLANPNWWRMGPLTMINGADPAVLADVPCRLNSGATMHSTAVSTTGMYSARHPAITAAMATFSTVITRPRTGSVLSTSPGSRCAASRNRSTRSSVGGITGRPSVQPFW